MACRLGCNSSGEFVHTVLISPLISLARQSMSEEHVLRAAQALTDETDTIDKQPPSRQ